MGVVDVSDGVKLLQQSSVPVYQFPESAARALGALYAQQKWLSRRVLPQYPLEFDKEKADQIISRHIDAGEYLLDEMDGGELLKCYGFRTLEMEIAKTANEAVEIADRIGYPVAMKIVSPQILHKSDAGGVKIGIDNSSDLKSAFEKIMKSASDYNPSAQLRGVLVQEMARPGKEVILGASRHSGFGHAVMFGLGGIFVEIYKDVVFRMAPMGRNVVRRMVKSIKGYPILAGFRGEPKADIETLEKNLISLRAMVDNHPVIKELDINPLFVHKEGAGTTVADIIIRLEPLSLK